MAAAPGDELAAAGHGHLRASRADREQVIGTLKDAFAQERLTKDELELRVGQAFAARTYADLAALTADLPAQMMTAQPALRPRRARARRPGRKAIAWATCAAGEAGGLIAWAAALHYQSVPLLLLAWVGTYGGLCGAGYLVADSWKKWKQRRSRGQLPPRPARPGQAVAGGGDIITGTDLALSQDRSAARHLPGRSLPVGQASWWAMKPGLC